MRDIFLPLTSGATLCLPERPDRMNPWGWLEREGITIVHSVPSLVAAWLQEEIGSVELPSLRYLFLGGEPLLGPLVSRWREWFPRSGDIVNLYGSTETPQGRLFHQVPQGDGLRRESLPIGGPIDSTQALVLNKADRLCGIGELGEIVIRTPFRSHGYLDTNQPCWVRNPLGNCQDDLVYRTGDLGRYLADGRITLSGRVDDQVKIRGVRIEPAEVAAVLGSHRAVENCHVAMHNDDRNESRLVAWIAPREGVDVSGEELRGFLSERLPPAFIPAVIEVLSKLPLSANGKVDRRALPSARFEPVTKFVAPKTPLETRLASIWSEVLEQKRIGLLDNFFEMGRHSLSAIRMASRIRREFGVELPLRSVFDRPTVKGLVNTLLELQLAEERKQEQGSPPPTAIGTTTFQAQTTSFHCPEESEWFGRRNCGLVIVINEQFDATAFHRIAEHVRRFDPRIDVDVVRDAVDAESPRGSLPTLVFSPALIRHYPSATGRVFCGFPMSKSQEYAALEKSGIPVPPWALLTERNAPDVSHFGNYVVRKPDYGGRGAEVSIVKMDRLKWKPITTSVAGESLDLIVQKFIYTGAVPFPTVSIRCSAACSIPSSTKRVQIDRNWPGRTTSFPRPESRVSRLFHRRAGSKCLVQRRWRNNSTRREGRTRPFPRYRFSASTSSKRFPRAGCTCSKPTPSVIPGGLRRGMSRIMASPLRRSLTAFVRPHSF